MSKPFKLILFVLAVILLFMLYIISDWYKFATSAQIDPQRGVYGNQHLEVWIDINARMPESMRQWACTTIRAREKAALGGTNTIPFHSCQPDFSSREQPLSRADSIISAYLRGALTLAAQHNPTAEQNALITSCMNDALTKALTPEQLDSLNADKPGTDAVVALNRAGAASRQECFKQAGLN